MGKIAQESAHFAVPGVAAAELGGNERGENPMLLEHAIVIGDECVLGVALSGAFGKARPDRLDESPEFDASRHGRTSLFERRHQSDRTRRAGNCKM